MDVDGARVAVGAVAPDPLEQRVAVEDPAGALRERGEDLELDVGELDPLTADPHLPAGEVDVELAGADRALRVARRRTSGCAAAPPSPGS